MAPKPASTAGKAPASTASKAPAKTEGSKAAKKTSKPAAAADGEKKKRKKSRKETYSSYIYKGVLIRRCCLIFTECGSSPQAGPPRHWDIQQSDGYS